MAEAIIFLGFAYSLGLIAKKLQLPSLIGYLIAGFALAALGSNVGVNEQSEHILKEFSHVGVILLLFGVGLKLNAKKIVKPEVIGTGVAHFFISALIFAPVIYLLGIGNVDWMMAIMLSVALSFSSTVLAAKTLESKNELKSFHGRIAVGILIVQDLLAMTYVSVASGTTPSVWAFSVLALPLIRPFLFRLIDWSGHDDLFLVAGLLLALGLGGYGFHAVGLSGELGALVVGALVAGHPRASEMSDRLWSLKELLLIAFFLTIGLNGLPTLSDFTFAFVMVALLPVQAAVFFFLLTGFKLKSRSAFLTTASLTNFSEFGLIVAAVVMPEWMVPLALAVAFSFLLSAPLNRFAHPIFDKLERFLNRYERDVRHPDEEPVSLGDANVLVLGIGRVGRAAYNAFKYHDNNAVVISLDSDSDKIEKYSNEGYNCCFADAEHGNFWGTVDTSNLKAVMLAMNCPDACSIAAKKLRKAGYLGYIVGHTMHEDDAERIVASGANEAYVTMSEAGESLANHVYKAGALS